MSKINFDEMDISWHYWAYNVLTGWAYKNGKKSGLGPFFARADSKVGTVSAMFSSEARRRPERF